LADILLEEEQEDDRDGFDPSSESKTTDSESKQSGEGHDSSKALDGSLVDRWTPEPGTHPFVHFLLQTAGEIMCGRVESDADSSTDLSPAARAATAALAVATGSQPPSESHVTEFGPGKARQALAAEALTCLCELSSASPAWRAQVWHTIGKTLSQVLPIVQSLMILDSGDRSSGSARSSHASSSDPSAK